MPALLLAEPLPPKHRTHGDALALKADEAFDRGKKLYQKNDIVNARMEFDAAIDLMLEAADADPEGRDEYCNRIGRRWWTRSTVTILAGLGASASLEQEQVREGPPRRYSAENELSRWTPSRRTRVREQVRSTVSQLPLVGERYRSRVHQPTFRIAAMGRLWRRCSGRGAIEEAR